MLTINLGDNVRLDLELILIDQLTCPIFSYHVREHSNWKRDQGSYINGQHYQYKTPHT